MNREVRTVAARFDGSADGKTLTGYAAVFDSPTEIVEWGFRFTETVRPGAFKRTLAAGGDVLCCFQHDPGRFLGRSSSGTATFSEDDRGLRFAVTLPDTPAGNEVRELVRRGDLNGASFSFSVPSGGDQWSSPTFRELVDVDLYEAGPVLTPAYDSTSVGLRANRPPPATPNDVLRLRLAIAAKRPGR